MYLLAPRDGQIWALGASPVFGLMKKIKVDPQHHPEYIHYGHNHPTEAALRCMYAYRSGLAGIAEEYAGIINLNKPR